LGRVLPGTMTRQRRWRGRGACEAGETGESKKRHAEQAILVSVAQETIGRESGENDERESKNNCVCKERGEKVTPN